MRFSYSEFRKFRWSIRVVGALIMIVGMPIWLPIVMYLNRPHLSPEVEKEYMERQMAAQMATNSAAPVSPSPSEH